MKKVRKGTVAFTIVMAVLLVILATVLFIGLRAKRENRPVSLFGKAFSVVVTGSMEPEIMEGDLIVIEETTIENVKVGDDVVFISQSGTIKGQSVVHRAIEIGEDAEGIFIRTKGVNNSVADADYVRAVNFIGIATGHSAFWGRIFTFVTNPWHVVLIVATIVAVYVAVRTVIWLIKDSKKDYKDGEK